MNWYAVHAKDSTTSSQDGYGPSEFRRRVNDGAISDLRTLLSFGMVKSLKRQRVVKITPKSPTLIIPRLRRSQFASALVGPVT